MRHKLLILAILLWVPQLQADIYKWRDEAGRIHYGAVPPPGVELEVIEGPRDRPPPPAPGPARATPTPPAAPAGGPPPGDDPARRVYASNCEQAREAVAALESGQPVVETGPDGSRTLLSDEQRQSRLERVRREEAFFCDA